MRAEWDFEDNRSFSRGFAVGDERRQTRRLRIEAWVLSKSQRCDPRWNLTVSAYPAALACVNAARDKLRVSLGLDAAKEACEAALDVFSAVVDEIIETPAYTLAWPGFKAEVSIVEDHLNPDLVVSVMADIAMFAGGSHDAEDQVEIVIRQNRAR